MITAGVDGIYIDLHVQPGARRSRVVGPHGDALKVAVSAPAVSGRANEALLLAMASLLEVPVRDLSLTSGHGSRRKRVFVKGVDEGTARTKIEATLKSK